MESEISATEIEKATGVDASSIRRIRREERKLENLSFEKGVKLYEYTRGRDIGMNKLNLVPNQMVYFFEWLAEQRLNNYSDGVPITGEYCHVPRSFTFVTTIVITSYKKTSRYVR